MRFADRLSFHARALRPPQSCCTVEVPAPWKGGNGGGIMPINAATRRHYTGINVLILWSARDEHGSPRLSLRTNRRFCDPPPITSASPDLSCSAREKVNPEMAPERFS
jgi:hypothetical protein